MTRLRVATLRDPAPGQSACGDWVGHWAIGAAGAMQQWLAVVDGLGHGDRAAVAAEAARQALDAYLPAAGAADGPEQSLAAIGPALADTRGAAIGLARIRGDRLSYAGVGNTRCIVWRAGQATRLPSRYGIVGEPPDPHDTAPDGWTSELAVQPHDWILMFSDGLDENLALTHVAPAWLADPAIMCAALLARWRVPRDDASILVAHVEAG